MDTLQGASYPTMTEAVVTLDKIKKGLQNLQDPLTIIEPFDVDSGNGKYVRYELAHEILSSTAKKLGGSCRRI